MMIHQYYCIPYIYMASCRSLHTHSGSAQQFHSLHAAVLVVVSSYIFVWSTRIDQNQHVVSVMDQPVMIYQYYWTTYFTCRCWQYIMHNEFIHNSSSYLVII
jgi:hypothetical protein